MSAETEIPLMVAAMVALLVVLGALVTLVGSYGLLRLESFYARVHPPTMGATLGATLVLAASAILFSVLQSRPVLHEIVIAVFMVVATPATFVMLVRAAMHRDGIDNAADAEQSSDTASHRPSDAPKQARD
jgi:multicomponent K+:H+ antiporter subunit G